MILVKALAAKEKSLFFFFSLDRLWPLADFDLVAPSAETEQTARSFLDYRGFDLRDYRSSSALVVETRSLDYIQKSFGAAKPFP